MPKITASLVVFTSLFWIPMGYARDDVGTYSVASVMARPEAKGLQDVKFFFGKSKHPKVKENLGQYETNKKTNALNKTDKEACEWVMLSALMAMHARAKKLGADAIVNIQSNYKNRLFSSETSFQCGAGTFVAGVALKGDFVKTK